MRLRLPAGRQGLYVDSSESEVLLPRGTKLKVVRIEDGVEFTLGPDETVTKRVITMELED